MSRAVFSFLACLLAPTKARGRSRLQGLPKLLHESAEPARRRARNTNLDSSARVEQLAQTETRFTRENRRRSRVRSPGDCEQTDLVVSRVTFNPAGCLYITGLVVRPGRVDSHQPHPQFSCGRAVINLYDVIIIQRTCTTEFAAEQ